MYVRSKVVKGKTYYQIVEGVREGPRVRQRVVLALGTTQDPRRALEQWKRGLQRLRRERAQWAPWPGMSKTTARRLERLDAKIADLESHIAKLTSLIKSKMIGTTKKYRGRVLGAWWRGESLTPRRSKD
jgi:hypothetical protein